MGKIDRVDANADSASHKSARKSNVVKPPQQPVLSSWKDIANYFGKGVRTVQRWERELGLPIRRPNGHANGIVLAYPHELRRWSQPKIQCDLEAQGNRQDHSR
jgi:hypothetical protein